MPKENIYVEYSRQGGNTESIIPYTPEKSKRFDMVCKTIQTVAISGAAVGVICTANIPTIIIGSIIVASLYALKVFSE